MKTIIILSIILLFLLHFIPAVLVIYTGTGEFAVIYIMFGLLDLFFYNFIDNNKHQINNK